MPQKRKTLISAGLCFSLFSTLASAAPNDHVAGCYGSVLEVVFNLDSDAEADPRTVEFRLPFPIKWYVETDLRSPLRSIPCLEEPIATEEVIGGFHPKNKVRTAGAPDVLREVRIFTGVTPRLTSAEEPINPLFPVFTNMDRDRGVLGGPSEGIWSQYPIDGPVFWRCNSWTCTIRYQIEDGLHLQYKVADTTPNRTAWSEYDAAIRKMISTWTKEN